MPLWRSELCFLVKGLRKEQTNLLHDRLSVYGFYAKRRGTGAIGSITCV